MSKKRKKEFTDLDENRYGLFMDDSSFDLEVVYGRQYLETDVNFIVKIYRIDVLKTKSHDLYGQTKSSAKRFFAPVKLNAMVDIEDNDQKRYGDETGGLTREDTGNIEVKVYLKELKEKNIDVNRGDIIEYNLSGEKPRYYEVESAQNVVDSTSQTLGSFKPYWKRIVGVPVKEDITPYLKGDKLAK